MQKTSINPRIYQAMLDCAANAAQQGQSQFFTPLEFGKHLATALPAERPVIVDLNCGEGHLLQSAAAKSTKYTLGADIDPCETSPFAKKNHDRVTTSITRLLPILTEAGFAADLFTLNPPWRLFFFRKLFADLAESDCLAVREAFKQTEPGLPAGTIDSTIAMLSVALHLSTRAGEGFLIANNNTLQRLLFYPNSPHRALVPHIWARLTIPGNPMTGLNYANFQDPDPVGGATSSSPGGPHASGFHTGVIYFARDHTNGPREYPFESIQSFYATDLKPMRDYRMGAEVRSAWNAHSDTYDLWTAARQHLAELDGRQAKVPYNLWLSRSNLIRTDLSLFDKVSRKVKKRNLQDLQNLNGKAPMQLVLQRNTREHLLDLAEHGGWRVHPDLLAAVNRCIHEYHAQRAPLYPLPETQRLGYLDEADLIECKLDLGGHFTAGLKYPLRTQTVSVTRHLERPNSMTGESENLAYTGQELAFFIDRSPIADQAALAHYELEEEFCFMEARLRDDPKTEIQSAKRVKHNRSLPPRSGRGPHASGIDYTLQELCRHFVIPEVPDVATISPTEYEHNLELLTQLEVLTSLA